MGALAAPGLAAAQAPSQTRGPRLWISITGAACPGVAAWPEKARLAAKYGYGGVDWDFAPAKAAGLEATKALFDELKIRPTICSLPVATPFAGEDQAFRDKLPQLAEDAAFAAEVGCERMMLVMQPIGPAPKEEHRKRVRDRLSAMSEALAPSKIRLGLEFLGPQYMRSPTPPPPAPGAPPPTAPPAPRIPFIWTLPETLQLAKDSGPNIGAVLDIWHWRHSGGTIADILAADPARIVHVHLSDAKPMPAEDVRDNMRVLPGEGQADVTGFLSAVQRIGYRGAISPEPLGRFPPGFPPEEAARMSYETALAAMKTAGVI